MCSKTDSHSLVSEDGFNSVFVIAHETGHVLGMEHDGHGTNRCGDDRALGSIMAPTVESNFRKYHWSSCSREELKMTIDKFQCLWNDPHRSNPSLGKANSIESPIIYSLDEQCKFDFGSSFALCKSVSLKINTFSGNNFFY
jgi:hypothetical protein